MIADSSYWVTWFPGALVALLGALVLLFKAFRTFVRISDAMPTLLSAAAELRNNGGMSVKDDVQHIRRVQAVMQSDFAEHVVEDRRRFDAIEGKLP